jgi:hypothetical protein
MRPSRWRVRSASDAIVTNFVIARVNRLNWAKFPADNTPMPVRSSSMVRRLCAAAGLVGAYIVMASVFSPDRSRAGSYQQISDPTAAIPSTNPHEWLHSLGSLETLRYSVRMYSTDRGPRYSIYQATTGEELGVLLSADDVLRFFPDLDLRAIKFDAEPSADDAALMIVVPE